MKSFLLLCLVGTALALDRSQLKGLQKLLKNLGSGVYPTCQLVLFSELVDFDTAEKRCENFDIGTGGKQKGNLATVNDDDKNTDLKLLLEMAFAYRGKSDKWANDHWVWAGLRKTKNNSGKKKDKKYNALDWEWADGSNPDKFQKWMKHQPDQKVDSKDGKKYLQNQMRINHQGIWDDTFTYKTHPYACDYQGKYIISDSDRTWTQAKGACEEAGLMLAKVRSDAEVTELLNAANYFLGEQKDLNTWDSENWLWLGGTDVEEEGVWKWVDGSPIDYFDNMDWLKPNPDNADFLRKTTQNVLSMSRWGQFDDSYDHRRRQRAFACQCPGT